MRLLSGLIFILLSCANFASSSSTSTSSAESSQVQGGWTEWGWNQIGNTTFRADREFFEGDQAVCHSATIVFRSVIDGTFSFRMWFLSNDAHVVKGFLTDQYAAYAAEEYHDQVAQLECANPQSGSSSDSPGSSGAKRHREDSSLSSHNKRARGRSDWQPATIWTMNHNGNFVAEQMLGDCKIWVTVFRSPVDNKWKSVWDAFESFTDESGATVWRKREKGNFDFTPFRSPKAAQDRAMRNYYRSGPGSQSSPVRAVCCANGIACS